MSAMNTLKKFGLEQAFNYVYKDPDKNFIKIMVSVRLHVTP